MASIKRIGRFNESAIKKTFKGMRGLYQITDGGAYISESHLIIKVTDAEFEQIRKLSAAESWNENDILEKMFAALTIEPISAKYAGVTVNEHNNKIGAVIAGEDLELFNDTYTSIFLNMTPQLASVINTATDMPADYKSAAYYDSNGYVCGAILPVRDKRIKKMFAALLEPAEPEPEKVVTYESHRDIAKAEPEPTPEPVKAEEPAPEPQPEPSSLADKANTYKATFEKLAGVTVLVKGEKTACPIVWVGGETKPHKDALKAAGCKWAPKKKMWYIHVA